MIGLSRIGMLLRSEGWRQAEATGLTPTQAQILAHLAARGPARIGMIATEIDVTQPTASDAVAALVREGYVEKLPDTDDARAARLHQTDSGERLAREGAVGPDATMGAVELTDDGDRESVGEGKGVSVRWNIGGRRNKYKKKN